MFNTWLHTCRTGLTLKLPIRYLSNKKFKFCSIYFEYCKVGSSKKVGLVGDLVVTGQRPCL